MDDFELYDQYLTAETSQLNASQGLAGQACVVKHLCKHENCWNEICIDCGEEQDGTIDHTKFFESKDITIRKSELNPKEYIKDICADLEKLGLDPETQSRIFDMYFKICQEHIYRSKLRKAIICACTATVCNLIDKPQDEKKLCDTFNITKRDQSKGLKMVKLNIKESRLIYYGMKEYIIIFSNIIIEKLGFIQLRDNLDKIIAIGMNINSDNKNIKIMAAGIIYKWMCTNNINITINAFSSACQIPIYIFVQTIRHLPSVG